MVVVVGGKSGENKEGNTGYDVCTDWSLYYFQRLCYNIHNLESAIIEMKLGVFSQVG